jgi:hypothetical protein
MISNRLGELRRRPRPLAFLWQSGPNRAFEHSGCGETMMLRLGRITYSVMGARSSSENRGGVKTNSKKSREEFPHVTLNTYRDLGQYMQ